MLINNIAHAWIRYKDVNVRGITKRLPQPSQKVKVIATIASTET
jgi:hypothetical protein